MGIRMSVKDLKSLVIFSVVWADQNYLAIPDFSIFVTMMIITFFLHADQNYFVFLIRMDAHVDLVGLGRNVTGHVRLDTFGKSRLTFHSKSEEITINTNLTF